MLTSLRLVRIPRSSRPPFAPVSRRTLFNFSWWSGGGVKKDEPKEVEVEKAAPGTPDVAASAPTSSSSDPLLPSTSDPSSSSSSPSTPSPSSDPSSPSDLNQPPTPAQTRAQKESAAIRALLDRDGGSAGFGYEDVAPEGGQRRSVKREMFRLI